MRVPQLLPAETLASKPYGRNGRLQAAVKKDKRQSQGAEGMRGNGIIKNDPADTVLTCKHAGDQEQHEHRQPQTGRQFAGEHTEQDQYCCQQQ